jgi:glycosyltransferase involved in cell wall biosynthesis
MIKRGNTIRVVYNGLDIDEFSSPPQPGLFKERYGIQARFLVVYLGRIHHRKGIEVLVEACAKLHKEGRDVALAIVGADEGYQHVLESLIDGLSFREQTRFIGVLTGQAKLTACVDADVLVYASGHELFGMVPCEAIMCNTPAIVANDSGCGEIISRIGGGYLVHYGDVSQLKDAITHVLECPEEARDRARKGRQYIIQNLTWDKIIDQVENIYTDVLSEREQT